MKKLSLLKFVQFVIISAIFTLSACGGSSSDGGSTGTESVNLTGTLIDPDDSTVADAAIVSRNADNDEVFDSTTSASDGTFSIAMPKGIEAYVNATKATYVSSNTEIVALDVDLTNTAENTVLIIPVANVDMVVNLVDGSTDWASVASNRSLFALDVYQGIDDNDSEGVIVTGVSSVNPSVVFTRYNNCAGAFNTGPTPTPACTDRMGPMLAGKLTDPSDAALEANVTFTATGGSLTGSENSVKLPLRIGEVSFATIYAE